MTSLEPRVGPAGARWSRSCTGRWTGRRRWCCCRGASTTTTACCATTAAGYARSHGAGGPFTMDAHVADLADLLDGRRGRWCSGTATAATWRWRWPSGIRSWCGRSPCTRCRCRGCRGGRVAPGRRGAATRRLAGGRRRAVHAPDGRRRAVGGALRSRPALPGGAEGVAFVDEIADLGAAATVARRAHRRAVRGDVRVADPRAPPRRLSLPRRAAVRPARRSPSRAPGTTARSPTPRRSPR